MLRRVLAVLLVLFLVMLSGYDLLTDLDSSVQGKIKNTQNPARAGIGKFAAVANDVLENASHKPAQRAAFSVLEQPHPTAVRLPESVSNRPETDLKIYKLHRVFLI